MDRKERTAQMADLYRKGSIMQEIASVFCISRARVQAILASHGITGNDGGLVVRASRHRRERAERLRLQRLQRQHAWALAQMGSPLPNLLQSGYPASGRHPLCKKYRAILRLQQRKTGMPYLGYLDWCRVWDDSGHLNVEVGPEPGWGLVRIDAAKGWTPDNVQVVRMGTWLPHR